MTTYFWVTIGLGNDLVPSGKPVFCIVIILGLCHLFESNFATRGQANIVLHD